MTSNFDWKNLEEKPANWELIQSLIGSAEKITAEILGGSRGAIISRYSREFGLLARDVLSERWGSRPEFRPLMDVISQGDNTTKQKKKKKDNIKKADQIRLVNMNKMVRKDLDKISFDPTGRPIIVKTHFEETFIIMLMEWAALVVARSDNNTRLSVECAVALDRFEAGTDDESPLCAWFGLVRSWFREKIPVSDAMIRILLNDQHLMLHSIVDKRRDGVRLYRQQEDTIRRIVESVIDDRPILMGNRMPPGTGKTFMAVPLAQALLPLQRKKTVLFCCPNVMVRKFVAGTALLGHDLHMWMGVMARVDDTECFLIRPHKKCFPATWKKIYKEDNLLKYGGVAEQIVYYEQQTRRHADILVCDMATALEILSSPSLRDNYVAVLDEVIGDDKTTRHMTQIMKNLPMHSIVMSAILPRFDQLDFMTDRFNTMHPGAIIEQIDTSGVTISCTVIGPDGVQAFPHDHYGFDDIPRLVYSINEDPLIRRMYSAADIYDIYESYCRQSLEEGVSWACVLPSIGLIEFNHVIGWWIRILEAIHSGGHTDIWDKIRTAHKPVRIPGGPRFLEMFTTQASEYRGKHLHVISNDMIPAVYHEMGQNNIGDAPDLGDLRKDRDGLLSRINSDIETLQKSKMTRNEKMMQMSEMNDEVSAASVIKWPLRHVINSRAHYARWHGGAPPPTGTIERRAIDLSMEYEHTFDEWSCAMMMSGSVLFDQDRMSDAQCRMAIRLFPDVNFIVSGRELVFGTNIDGLIGLSISGEFGRTNSRSVLYQLIGRTGRIHMSYTAKAVIDCPETLSKIMTPVDKTVEDPDALLLRRAWIS